MLLVAFFASKRQYTILKEWREVAGSGWPGLGIAGQTL